MDEPTIEQLMNNLRLIATTSTDRLSKAIALDILGETSQQATTALMGTTLGKEVCEGKGDLRAAAKRLLMHSGHAEVVALLAKE